MEAFALNAGVDDIAFELQVDDGDDEEDEGCPGAAEDEYERYDGEPDE